ncbi:MAG: 23S rRNA (uracil(1939)-C(5))-methyltransferase RlmD [Eubacteriales bacterium]|nr:23S rRNA (uracil(1939)-C(5))-methyltransferase RlmD [Eubacteriales bacterium]
MAGRQQGKSRKDSLSTYKKGQEIRARITDIGMHGEGIGRLEDGYTVFIKDAVIGDYVRASVMKAGKTFAYAHLDQILQASPHRVEPLCPVARQCGGCQLQALSYEQELVYKQNKVRSDLIRIGGFSGEEIDAVMEPIVGMQDHPGGPWRYRNKAQVPVGYSGYSGAGKRRPGSSRVVAGFYAGRTHSIIPMTDCLLGDAVNKDIIERVLTYMELHRVPPYDEETGKGLIRHILIRGGRFSGQIMVCLVVNGESLPYEADLVDHLSGVPGMTSIVLNTNTERTNVILGKKLRTLWGKDEIEDTLQICDVVKESEAGSANAAPQGMQAKGEGMCRPDGRTLEKTAFMPTGETVTFGISPLSFYQVNPEQTLRLYSLALDYAGLSGKETVWDLYCGVGTISLFMAGHARKVCGVEVIPEAIENAKQNAARNGIENAVFYVGKAEEVLPGYVQARRAAGLDPGIDVICVDPPRKGCDAKCLETILEIQPDKIVYVSCDPATLARDLRILTDGGYELKKVRPVDQFAHTVHVETIVLLQKLNS